MHRYYDSRRTSVVVICSPVLLLSGSGFLTKTSPLECLLGCDCFSGFERSASTTTIRRVFLTQNQYWHSDRTQFRPTNCCYSNITTLGETYIGERCWVIPMRVVTTARVSPLLPIASSPDSKKNNTPKKMKIPPSANNPVPIFLLSDIMATTAGFLSMWTSGC